MVTFRDARSVLLALALVSVVATATAAGFPDTVQRTFVVEGAPARELAALFAPRNHPQPWRMTPATMPRICSSSWRRWIGSMVGLAGCSRIPSAST